MKENAKFLKCPICDNIIELIDGDVQHIICCGRKMEEMKANTTDAATEKAAGLPVNGLAVPRLDVADFRTVGQKGRKRGNGRGVQR